MTELLGPDPSVGQIGDIIAGRAAGNPFFAEEITRDLAERGVLSVGAVATPATSMSADVHVPATLQATIAARIDRLDPAAKHTLTRPAVIGSRFDHDLLTGSRPIRSSTSSSPPSSSTRSGSPRTPSTRFGTR